MLVGESPWPTVAGLVIARDAEPGSTVVAGQSVLQLIDPASLWLRMRIDQGRSSGLRAGLPAEIVLRSRPGERFPGQVTRVLVSFNRRGRYVDHCHILSHEEHDMMRWYEVI